MVFRKLKRVKLRYFISVLAAGFSAGFVTWAALRGAQLPAFILNNQLSSGERDILLACLGGGVLLSFGLWLGASLVLFKGREVKAEEALTYAAAPFVLLAPSGVLPLLLLPRLGTDYPFMTAFLIMGVCALLYLGVREVQAARRGLALASHPVASEDASLENDGERARNRARGGLIGVTLLSATYAAIFSIFTISEHVTFHTHAYDLGIFDQVMYYAAQRGEMLFTVVHNPPESFWSVHFSPALYVLTPFYALYQDARTLLVLQSFLLGAGAVVLYLLTLHLTKRTLLAVALSVSYLLFAALHTGDTDFGYATWAGLFAFSAVGNLVGGVGLVTLLRLLQVPHRVRVERQSPQQISSPRSATGWDDGGEAEDAGREGSRG